MASDMQQPDTRTTPGARLLPALRRLCGLLAAAIGLTALLGWFADFPLLATFGSGKIPMAPSTALFFLLFGLAASFLDRIAATGRLARLLFVAGAAAATLTALLLMVLSARGIHPSAEYLGLPISGMVNGSPIGHMSPLTAFCFVLAGSALLTGLQAGPRHRWPAAAAFCCGGLVSLISFALLLAYLLGAPLLYGSGIIPPALSTSLAFLLLGISLQIVAGPSAWPHDRLASLADTRTPYVFALIFILLGAGIITASFLSFRKHEKEYRLGVEQQLSAIAELKAMRIADWLSGQQRQAEELAANPGFVLRLQRWLEQGTESEREIVLSRLTALLSIHGYEEATLLDSGDRVLFNQGGQTLPEELPHGMLARARADGRVMRCDLHRDSAGKVRLTWVIPITTPPAEGGRLLATVLFASDPEQFLFPFVRSWPTPSRTAETLLVRREGNQALFLNPLRFQEDAALRLRIPLRETTIPAVQAVLGKEGVVEGLDYRGKAVVAALRPVPGSSWFLVARMDMAEIYAPLRERLWLMVVLLLALLLGAGAAVLVLWHRLEHAHRLALFSAAAEKDRLYALELEKRVAERTSQLAAANRELEAFSYSVSHDLKAPLRGIDGYSRLLAEEYHDRLDNEGRGFLDNIRSGVGQMHELIEDLLAYSRMERRALHSDSLDLPSLVRTVLAECRAEITRTGAVVRTAVPAITVHADREGLTMALRNLLENALKFSGNSRPVAIDIGARSENGTTVLWVRDNGIGFDLKFHDRIFEIFSRLERAEDFPGTGVGLALVRKAMQRMGGRVWAESEPGRGAAFFLELPENAITP